MQLQLLPNVFNTILLLREQSCRLTGKIPQRPLIANLLIKITTFVSGLKSSTVRFAKTISIVLFVLEICDANKDKNKMKRFNINMFI